MTDEPGIPNWEDRQLAALYDAVLQRMITTYILNELVKSGVKTPLKDGILDKLRGVQKQQNFIITSVVRRIDRGTAE